MAEVSSDAINSLAEKLDGFASDLSDEERSALGGVLARAEAASEAEVGGFASADSLNFKQAAVPNLKPGLGSQLGRSLGGPALGNPAALTISWGW